MDLKRNDTVAFLGDSITEWGRDLQDITSLGLGYVSKLVNSLENEQHSHRKYYNFGKRGYKVENLIQQLPQIKAIRPDVIILLVGVNDVWHYMNHKEVCTLDEEKRRFKTAYRTLIQELLAITPRLLVLEPFLFICPLQRLNWRVLLDANIQSIRQIVYQNHVEYVALDGRMMEETYQFAGDKLTKDGVHPESTAQYLIVEQVRKHLTLV